MKTAKRTGSISTVGNASTVPGSLATESAIMTVLDEFGGGPTAARNTRKEESDAPDAETCRAFFKRVVEALFFALVTVLVLGGSAGYIYVLVVLAYAGSEEDGMAWVGFAVMLVLGLALCLGCTLKCCEECDKAKG